MKFATQFFGKDPFKVFDYVSGTKWRQGGDLPSPLAGHRASLLAGVLHLTGM